MEPRFRSQVWAWLRGAAAGAICVAMLLVTVLTFGELLDSSPTNATPQHAVVLTAPAKHPAAAFRDDGYEWRHPSPPYRACAGPGQTSSSSDSC